MGWQEMMGATSPNILSSNPKSNNSKNSKNQMEAASPNILSSNPKSNNSTNSKNAKNQADIPIFADIAIIADSNQTLKKQRPSEQSRPVIIKKMKTCLHGYPCYNLILKNDRQVCRRSGQPIFDMDSCPDGRWFKPKDPGSILWEQAWALATWIDDNSETGAPIEERRARLPELIK